MNVSLYILVLSCLWFSSTSFADIKFGNSGAACVAGTAGSQRYVGGKMEFCNGAAWATISEPDLAVGTVAGDAIGADAVPNCTSVQKLEMSLGPTFTWSCVTDNDNGATSIDGLSDGRTNGTSVFLGAGAGASATGPNNTYAGVSSGGASTTGHNNTATGYQSFFSNTSGWYNTAIGSNSLRASISGVKNTAVGAYSLRLNTSSWNTAVGASALSSNSSGSKNTAIGADSLAANTTGSNNTATGSESLQVNTTGGFNTATGHASLKANTTGGSNVANGFESLNSNTTGSSNTSSGSLSMERNTTGFRNTASGDASLRYLTTGNSNAAFGARALMMSTTANGNTAIGYNSMGATSTGRYNVATGNDSLRSNTTGIYNVSIGANSLYSITTGQYNSALGYSAGRYVNGGASNQTSTYSIYLGESSRAGADGNTNEIVIGSSAIGAGSNSVTLGHTTITNTVLRGDIAIDSAGGYIKYEPNGAACTDGQVLEWDTSTETGAWICKTAVAGATSIDELSDGKTGGDSVALGPNAGTNDDQTSNRNTFIGTASGRDSTTGYYNVAVGYGSLLSNIGGSANTSVGNSSMWYNTSGVRNVAVGANSMQMITTADDNTATGAFSLNEITTGGRNVAGGYVAGRYVGSGTTKNQTSNNSIYLGYDVRGGADGNTNEVVIGRSAIGSGSNSVTLGHTDITKTVLRGNVGIGTTAPSHKLHVIGTAGLSTGTAWTNTSDIRLKDIQGDYEYGLNEILKLHTVRFNYKKGNPLSLPSNKNIVGFIAQEVQEIIPEAVVEREDGYLELNVDPIHWASVNAIQELYGICKVTDSQVVEISRRVASLEAENVTLKIKKNREIASLKIAPMDWEKEMPHDGVGKELREEVKALKEELQSIKEILRKNGIK